MMAWVTKLQLHNTIWAIVLKGIIIHRGMMQTQRAIAVPQQSAIVVVLGLMFAARKELTSQGDLQNDIQGNEGRQTKNQTGEPDKS